MSKLPKAIYRANAISYQNCNDFFKNKDFIYLSEKESERAQAGGAAGRGRSRLPSEQGVQGRTQFQDLGIVAEFFSPLVPVVLGHAALKHGVVDQPEWWAAKQGLWSITKVIVQSSQGGREPKRFAPSVTFFFQK